MPLARWHAKPRTQSLPIASFSLVRQIVVVPTPHVFRLRQSQLLQTLQIHMPVRKQHIHIPAMPSTQIGNRKAISRIKHIPTSRPPTGASIKPYIFFHVLSRISPIAGAIRQVNHRRRRPNLTRPNRNHGSLPSVPRPRRLIRLPSPRTHPQPAGTSTNPGASALFIP